MPPRSTLVQGIAAFKVYVSPLSCCRWIDPLDRLPPRAQPTAVRKVNSLHQPVDYWSR
jgi:hypothetical protein